MIRADLISRLHGRQAVVGVIGLGYVGLPLAAATTQANFQTVGFDVDPEKVAQLNAGNSYIGGVPSDLLRAQIEQKQFRATTEFDDLASCDVIVICVPTPLTPQREPDTQYIEATALQVAKRLKSGQLVILESTTYPGTTDSVVRPILERDGRKSGEDFLLAYSPEREDPGNLEYGGRTIPRIVAGDGPAAAAAVEAFYGAVVEQVVPVSSLKTAEAAKITENVFRAVNIALANELKMIYDAMGIDVWEVIDAAATKPFGYMPFYPGPGLGGHCIPIDPFYLAWKSREFGVPTRFIELAGEINVSMPHYVLRRLEEELDRRQRVSFGSAHILLVGIAYKKNIADIRESPALTLLDQMLLRGVRVEIHDPHVPKVPNTRNYPGLSEMKSVNLTRELIEDCNAVLICTDHDRVDYRLICQSARLVVDTRNAIGGRGLCCSNVVKV